MTTLLHTIVGSFTVMTFCGQVSVQTAVTTVTVKVQVVALFEASVAVQVTVAVPVGKLEPDGGLQKTCMSCVQLSVAVGVE